MTKKIKRSLLIKLAPKKILEQNSKAVKIFEDYKKTSGLIELTNISMGKKPTFEEFTGSTINFEVNQNGVLSTTSQKI